MKNEDQDSVKELPPGSMELLIKIDKLLDEKIKTGNEELRKLIFSGFPDDNPVSHRLAHEATMRQIEARAQFWEKLRFEIVRYGLLGFIGWAAINGWRSFVASLHG